MNDPTRNHLIDAMRDRRDATDPELPELQALAEQLRDESDAPAERCSSDEMLERSLAWDEHVREAMEDVPLPAGLAERLQSAVANATATEQEHEVKPAGTDAEKPSPQPATPYGSRRWVWAAAAAVAASLVAAIALWPDPQPATINGFQLTQMAADWTESLEGSGEWAEGSGPAHRPWDPSVRQVESPQWRLFPQLGDSRAVAYRGSSMLLLVLEAPQVEGLGAAPPYEPQFDTGRYRIGAWRSGDLVYVLVVNGDLDRYRRSLVRPPFA